MNAFVKNCWYAAAWDHEVAQGKILPRTIADQRLVIYRTEDQQPAVLEDRCCHRHAPLSEGRVNGNDIQCMYHGLKFGPDEICTDIPGQSNIPIGARVRSFRTVERHNLIWIWLGDPALGDPELIPDAIGFDRPDWIMKGGYLRYEADPMLVADNAMDFSHITYVHPTTFGGTDQWVTERPKVERIPRGVRVSRWLKDVEPPPYLQRFKNHRGNIDRWSSYDFLVPGVLLLRSDMYPTGSDPADKSNVIFSYFASNCLMPESSEATHSFFRWGPRSNEDPAIIDILIEAARAGFAEDKKIIEAQHQVVKQDRTAKMMTIAVDTGVVMMRRVFNDMLEAEASQAA